MVDNFIEELLHGLQCSRVESEYDFQITEVIKRNDEHRLSLCIRRKGDSIGVNLYVDDLAKRYEEYGRDMDELIKDVIVQLKYRLLNNSLTESAVETVMQLKDYDSVKDSILFRIVSEKENAEYLRNAVYVPFLDLAVCFYLPVGEGRESGTILITKEVFKLWNISMEELYQQAMKNTPVQLPYQFSSMLEVLERLMHKLNIDNIMNHPAYLKSNFGMWVLSNCEQYFGASAILYKGLMKKIALKIGAKELVILPSSLHECILLPLSKDFSTCYFQSMVREINATQLNREDKLSDSIYLYSLEKDEITILTE